MISIMKHFTKKDWIITALIFVITIVEVVSGLMTIEYMEKIVGLVLESSPLDVIFMHGGIMIAFALFSVLMSIVTSFLTVKIATGYARTLRHRLFTKVNSFTMEEVNRFTTASLITRSTNDIQQVQMAVTYSLRIIFVAPIIAIASIAMIVNKSKTLTLTTAVGIVLLVLSIAVTFFIVSPKFKKIQSLTDRLNNVSREHLTGLRVVKAYNAEGYQQGKLEEVNTKLTNTQKFTTRMMGAMMPWCQLIMNGLGLAILWIGAYLIGDNRLTLPEMTSFQLYANMVLEAFIMMTMITIMLPRAAISAKRINEVLETEPSVKDSDNALTPSENTRGKVEFRHVSFGYRDSQNYAIHDISFTLNKGETLAIIGATGSGKTSIINLIPRFYDASEGEVLVDDVNVKNMSQSDLRSRIGLVPQKATLFSGSIESNIKFSDKNMSDDEMLEASRIAEASEFIEEKEDTYNSRVSQGGKNLSGGQKQRLSIARAIAKKPEIYIFDDSFSALDYATDKRLRASLRAVTKDSSVIIVAQRIGTIMNADKIIVLDKGEIVGMGSHKELIATNKIYKEIALSQLSEEELANA